MLKLIEMNGNYGFVQEDQLARLIQIHTKNNRNWTILDIVLQSADNRILQWQIFYQFLSKDSFHHPNHLLLISHLQHLKNINNRKQI